MFLDWSGKWLSPSSLGWVSEQFEPFPICSRVGQDCLMPKLGPFFFLWNRSGSIWRPWASCVVRGKRPITRWAVFNGSTLDRSWMESILERVMSSFFHISAPYFQDGTNATSEEALKFAHVKAWDGCRCSMRLYKSSRRSPPRASLKDRKSTRLNSSH